MDWTIFWTISWTIFWTILEGGAHHYYSDSDSAQIDSKGARITQQWRIVNAIFSIQIKVQR